jgi:hypothetical protein
MHNLFAIPVEAITRLSSESAVSVLKALLQTEVAYAKLPPSVLTISQRLTMADGGIDAEINAGATTPSDCLFIQGLTGYQIKSGATFKPWTKSSIKGELINSNGKLFEAVERLLERDGSYVVLSTGHDLTPQQRNKARNNIKQVFDHTGFSGYKGTIDVLGAAQLADYLARYPGIAAMVGVNPIHDAWAYQQWEQDSHMTNQFQVSPEQDLLIQKIRNSLREKIKHIRILGEPGLGKTRLLLEALRSPEFVSCVLYVRDGVGFGQSALFRSLIQVTRDKSLIVVLDDLSEFEMADVWRHLKGRCGFLQLISLDHASNETSTDEEILCLQAPQLPKETIKAILVDRAGTLKEIDRWIEICEGSPRVAQAVGDNLRANPEDLLKPPSTVPIWDRFVHGHGKRDDLLAMQIDCVVSYLALFSRFGYESPVNDEAFYIAKLIEKVEPAIGFARFQQIVKTLRDRRVLQGSKTLFFVPRALHIYLWKHFWESYGASFSFTETFSSMPESLHTWFMNMFKYAGDAATIHVVDEILDPNGLYKDLDVLTSAKGSRFLSTLAEANPAAVLRLLENTLGNWSDDQLLEFKQTRQNIVWTLEKTVVWPSFAVRSLRLLARLAKNENAENSNNATGVFLGLFRIGPEWAATEASPQIRLPSLLELLRSSAEKDKHLSLQAMESALDARGMGWRIVGPEYQGMRERAKLWTPLTYDDWWDGQGLYFSTLIDETEKWNSSFRKEVCETWLKVVGQQITNPRSTELCFKMLEQLLVDPFVNARKVNEFFYHWFEYRAKEEDKPITKRLRQLQRRFVQRSLRSRFQRYVIDVEYSEWDEGWRQKKGKKLNRSVLLATTLAKRVAIDPTKFTEIQDLLAPKHHSLALWDFCEQLAKHDPAKALLRPLIETALKTEHRLCLHAYLSALRSLNASLVQQTLSELLCTGDSAWLGTSIVLSLDFEDSLFGKCLVAYKNGWVQATEFRRLCWGHAIEAVSDSRVSELLTLLTADSSSASCTTLIDLLHRLSFDENSPFTPALVFDCVVATLSLANGSVPTSELYHWKEVSNKLLGWDPSYAMPLLERLFDQMHICYELSYDGRISPLAEELLQKHPAEAWILIVKMIEASLPKWRMDLLDWLKGGHPGFESVNARRVPIAFIDLATILQWIGVDPEERAALVAHSAPRTLSEEQGGRLTQELITRYAHIDGVTSAISSIFSAGGWTGPTSLYLRRRRSQFREWLSAGYSTQVNQWIEGQIEYLDHRIESEEIQEERSRFN